MVLTRLAERRRFRVCNWISPQLLNLISYRSNVTMRFHWRMFAAVLLLITTASFAEEIANEVKPPEPDTDLLALMSGRCSILNVAGRDFACRTVAWAHSTHGRAYFTIALDDPADHHHIISFSGASGRRTDQNLYELPVDRMLLNSKHRPKVDGLPVPIIELSSGMCRQIGNLAMGQVSSITCSATDKNGKQYELRFESDGSPITLRRARPSAPSIRTDG
jgi:hypothetical protein